MFTGKERDAEMVPNAYYFGARYYGSALGRFTSPDWSSKPAPVPYVDLKNPQTLNLYAYAQNNPSTNLDIDGHEDLWTLMDNSKVRNDITGQVSDANKNGQMALGGAELTSAAITGGATIEAASVFATAVGALTASGLLTSGSTRIVGTVVGAEPEKIEDAGAAVQTVTNPIGLATTLAKGNLPAGAVATDISNGVAAVSHPTEAAKDPVGTAITAGNLILDVKTVLSPPPPPAPPPPPPPPKMCGTNVCQ